MRDLVAQRSLLSNYPRPTPTLNDLANFLEDTNATSPLLFNEFQNLYYIRFMIRSLHADSHSLVLTCGYYRTVSLRTLWMSFPYLFPTFCTIGSTTNFSPRRLTFSLALTCGYYRTVSLRTLWMSFPHLLLTYSNSLY